MKTAFGLVLGCILVLTAAPSSSAAPAPESLKTVVVVMETSLGTITLELYADKAPETVKNFLRYAEDKFYDDMVFHRVIKDFMIQGGGLDTKGEEKPARDPIKNESANGLKNERGTIAVARAANPDSGTCQFFINLKDNAFLDRDRAGDKVGYCVFGKVIDGLDVVDKIAAVKRGSRGPMQDVPAEDVVIRSVRRLRK